VINFEAKTGIEALPRFMYENRSTKWAMFEFISSNPEILDVVEKSMPGYPGERINVRLKLAKKDVPGTSEVCIYASDSEEKIFDCYLFKIKYTYW